MNLIQTFRRFFLRKNKGITLIETMLSILLFSIISLILSSFLVTSYKTLKKAQKIIHMENNLMLFEQAMTREFSRIKAPFWTIPQKIEADGNSLTIPWYNGIQDESLVITKSDGKVQISSPEYKKVFNDLNLETSEHVFGDEKNYIRFVVKSNDKEQELLFRFSGFGIPQE